MDTALALEKLFPEQCQVLGIVTPGIVGERKAQGSLPASHLYFWPSETHARQSP